MRLIAVLTVLLSATAVEACPYVAPIYYRPAYKAQAVVYAPQPVIQYSITYNAPAPYPPQQQQTAPNLSPPKDQARDQVQQETVKLLQAMSQQLLSLDARMTAMEARLNQHTQPVYQTYELVLQHRCASCHDASVVKERKSKLTLWEDGKPAALSLAEQERVKREIDEGHMPMGADGKPAPLPESERRIIRERFEKGI